jgi:hypothetical protein
VLEYAAGSSKAHIYKSQTVDDFQNGLLDDTIRIMKLCGLKSISDLSLLNFFNNVDMLYSRRFQELSLSTLNPLFFKEAGVTKSRFSGKTGLSKYEVSSN